jgi:ABC-type phosphate transport system auxiliary subunit
MKELKLNEALCIIDAGWKTELEKGLYEYARRVVRKVAEEKHLEYQWNDVNEKLKKLKKEKEKEALCIIDAGKVGIGSVIPATEIYGTMHTEWKTEAVNHSEKIKKDNV